MSLRSRSRLSKQAVKPAANAGLTLYVAPDSPGSDWVRLVLAEKDIDSALVETIRPGCMNEDFAVLNPGQTLPTLADREGVLHGAGVIAEYLDERYPHPPLMPLAPSARARLRMVLRRFERELFPAAEASASGNAREAQSARRVLQEGLQAASRHFSARGWFSGAEYSLADCAWAALLHSLERAGPGIPGIDSLQRYAERLRARESYLKCFESRRAVP
jgi:RNA polymerase-associated protein